MTSVGVSVQNLSTSDALHLAIICVRVLADTRSCSAKAQYAGGATSGWTQTHIVGLPVYCTLIAHAVASANTLTQSSQTAAAH